MKRGGEGQRTSAKKNQSAERLGGGRIKDFATELERAYRLRFEKQVVPSFDELVSLIVATYGFDETRRKQIIRETVRIARAWNPPVIGLIVPDPRVAAMDSVRNEEADELRKVWNTHPLKKIPGKTGNDIFRSLLIASRALLLIEEHPELYHERKTATIRGTEK